MDTQAIKEAIQKNSEMIIATLTIIEQYERFTAEMVDKLKKQCE